MVSCRLLSLLIVLTSAPAQADWAFMSQHKNLEGNAIAYVGQVSQESKYIPDTYQTLEWYEFKRGFSTQFCFEFSGLTGLWGLGDKPALVLVDEQKSVKLAFIESSIGNIKVTIHSIVQVGCPSPY